VYKHRNKGKGYQQQTIAGTELCLYKNNIGFRLNINPLSMKIMLLILNIRYNKKYGCVKPGSGS